MSNANDIEYGRDCKVSAAFGYRKGDLYRIVATRGKAAPLFGTEGVLAWIGITGNPKAWPSSPDRERVARVGIRVAGQADMIFVDARNVLRIDHVTTDDERVLADSLVAAFSWIGGPTCGLTKAKRTRRTKAA